MWIVVLTSLPWAACKEQPAERLEAALNPLESTQVGDHLDLLT